MRLALRFAALSLAAALATACGNNDPMSSGTYTPPKTRPTLDPTYRASGHAAAGDVFVHLFEWRWDDIATECTTVLGPAGVTAVQVSPPEEHSITPSHDWSERYQPVRLSITRSRSGDSTGFANMVHTCGTAGVGIIVDAVINHMTNYPDPGTGSAGSPYTKYVYPGLFDSTDFHTPCGISDWNNIAQVQDCELFGLPDLNTEKSSVRRKLADYLIMLNRIGVAGFRIDAAKHIQQVSLDSIFRIVDSTAVAEGRAIPYYYLEVVGGGTPAPSDYYGEAYSSGGAADITEFTFVGVGDKFDKYQGQHISQLNPNGTSGNQFSPGAWGLMPSDKAVVFIQNHDSQHRDPGSSGSISYRDSSHFRLANVWMLAQPYGYPSILSAYSFIRPTENSMGPPSDGNGWTLNVQCASNWQTAADDQFLCEHRDPYILNMIPFRKYVAGSDQNHWWDNGANAIAFSRGNKGFVAINNEDTTVTFAVATGLPAGNYCDIISGGVSNAACAGTAVTIDQADSVHISLPALTAIAVHTGSHSKL